MTNEGPTDDAKLVEAVRAALPSFLIYSDLVRRGVFDRSPDFILGQDALTAALGCHPACVAQSGGFFGPKQVTLGPVQASNLCEVATAVGPEQAVDWINRVASKEESAFRVFAEVFGLELDAPVDLGNGVWIGPVEAAPSVGYRDALLNHWADWTFHSARPMHPPVLAWIDSSPIRRSPEPRYQASNAMVDRLRRTVLAFTLVTDCAPALACTWFEHADTDLQKSEVGRTWQPQNVEGSLLALRPVKLDQEALDWVRSYDQLPRGMQRVCDVALSRLGQARRRWNAGDKAIDGAICLESLLLRGENSAEMTYRLKIRAARLLSDDVTERQRIVKLVGEFYALRSRTVHGGTSEGQSDADIASQGVNLAGTLVRKIVGTGEMPNISQIELG